MPGKTGHVDYSQAKRRGGPYRRLDNLAKCVYNAQLQRASMAAEYCDLRLRAPWG
jgi:hypothetical protein